MTISVLRTADAWWVRHRRRGRHGSTPRATTTGALLADRAAIDAAGRAARRPSPVDTPRPGLPGDRAVPGGRADDQLRVARQGRRAWTRRPIPLTFFRKASGSISGPFDDIVKPAHVRFLDYEVEIGLVIGREIAGRHRRHRGQPRRLHRRPGGHQRRVRPRRPAAEDPVLRGQVLPDVHPGRARAGAAGRRRAQAVRRPAAAPVRQRRDAPGRPRRGRHDLPTAAGAAGADPVPATSTPATCCSPAPRSAPR